MAMLSLCAPRYRVLGLLLFFCCWLTACGNDEPITAQSQTEKLVATNWQMTEITGLDGNPIAANRLTTTTQLIQELQYQFRSDGSVRAIDPNQSNTVVNAGTWKLTADNRSIDVDVQGFKGNFPIITLSRTRLVLQQRAPVDGKESDIYLQFIPTV